MKELEAGFAWHVHHKELIEWCYDFAEREEFIRKYKPAEEQELRQRLLQRVRGRLPDEVIAAGRAYAEAGRAYDEARRVLDKAGRVYNEVEREAWRAYDEAWRVYDEAGRACDEAWRACDEAWRACDEAWRACDEAIVKCRDEISALHQVECPDCPWDGKTIFPAPYDAS